MEKLLTIVEEPRDETYQALLRFAARLGSRFSLVWREQSKFGETALEIIGLLKPDLVAEARTDEWPGTRLLGHMASVRTYKLSENAQSVLQRAHGLYDWQEPLRPEDLGFYTSDGRVWFGSIAHERDAFVYPSAIDLRELSTQVRGLRLEESR